MDNKLINFNSWDRLESESRLGMVFEDRFKDYGAFEVRKSYSKNKAWATIIACALALTLASVPLITQMFKKKEVKKKTFTTVVNTDDIPKDEEKKEDEPPPPPQQEQQVVATTQYVVPTVNPNTTQTATPPDFSDNFNPSLTTQKGVKDPFIGPIGTGTGGGPVTSTNNNPIQKADIEAQFVPGGDAGFVKFVEDNFQYPQRCYDEGINGAVVLQFIVEVNGTISQIKVESETKDCTEFTTEAIRVLQSSPAWTPAMYKGKFVRAWRRIPINLNISTTN